MKDYVFQCVRGTLFDQATLTCQEASKVDCDASERLYPELAAGDSAFFFNRIGIPKLSFAFKESSLYLLVLNI